MREQISIFPLHADNHPTLRLKQRPSNLLGLFI